jgi:hypothetical protein
MLNPSTADGRVDDPTIRRCIGCARKWGYPSLTVRNLFPLRATDPCALLTADDPNGGERGDAELLSTRKADLIVAAWGAFVPFGRDKQALELLNPKALFVLGGPSGALHGIRSMCEPTRN